MNTFARFPTTETPEERAERHAQEANERAAIIAAREAYVHFMRTGDQAVLASYEAWRRGERSWPWPDPTPEQREAADNEVRGLIGGLLAELGRVS